MKDPSHLKRLNLEQPVQLLDIHGYPGMGRRLQSLVHIELCVEMFNSPRRTYQELKAWKIGSNGMIPGERERKLDTRQCRVEKELK
jgi:hypothetical protein